MMVRSTDADAVAAAAVVVCIVAVVVGVGFVAPVLLGVVGRFKVAAMKRAVVVLVVPASLGATLRVSGEVNATVI